IGEAQLGSATHLVHDLAEQHAQQAVVSLGSSRDGWRVRKQPSTPCCQSHCVIHMEQPAARTAQCLLMNSPSGILQTSALAKVGPGIEAGVDVIEIEAGSAEVLS